MVHFIPITKARINLGSLAKRAYLKGEYFILEKDGIPVAGLISVDELENYLQFRDPALLKTVRLGGKNTRANRFANAYRLLEESKAYWVKKLRTKEKHKH
jgi:hypothetical protein